MPVKEIVNAIARLTQASVSAAWLDLGVDVMGSGADPHV
jgi:hypothetical protein